MTYELSEQDMRNNLKQYADLLENETDEYPYVMMFISAYGKLFNWSARPKDIRKRPNGTCYGSCQRFVMKNSGHTYCEGYAFVWRNDVQRLIPMRHAWVVKNDSLDVIDLTCYVFQGGPIQYIGIPISADDVFDITVGFGVGSSLLDVIALSVR
jgi:hypothetical protein